jgi:sugar lactone lactonase YvrE
MNHDYLFPARLTRRDFLKTSAAAAATLAVPAINGAAETAPVKFGSGAFTYVLDENWGKLPEGMKYGLGCGIVVDSKDRIFVTSRSANPCVAIFDKNGTLLETWSKEFADKVGMSDTNKVAATAHCIYWSKEGANEYLYFTENVAGGKNGEPRIGARVYKTDLAGKVLYTLGNVESEGSASQKFDFTNPTDVAVAANGDIYVVDGYGSQRVSRFDKNFKHIKTFGAKGTGQDQFNTCHGIWLSTLNGEPEVYIADRHNSRLQVYSPELNFKRTIAGDFVRNPCCFYQHAGHLYIPDLAAMVVIIDGKDRPVAILGDGKNVPKEEKEKRPEFIAPHALTVDSEGSIYVVEWVPSGRARKFKRAA